MQEIKKFIENVTAQFENLTFKHRYLILRELRQLETLDDSDKLIEKELYISEKLEEFKAFFEERKNNLPKITYDENLPVALRKDEIIKTIKENQVVIIAGETGSGKTTQIPKMCLEAGLGLKGFIGHTQPRRIAARAVAQRMNLLNLLSNQIFL